MATKSRFQQQIAATRRREENARRHAAQMAKHAARRAAIAQYEAAFKSWADAEDALIARAEAEGRDCTEADYRALGPCPLDPRFHDRALFPENFAPVE